MKALFRPYLTHSYLYVLALVASFGWAFTATYILVTRHHEPPTIITVDEEGFHSLDDAQTESELAEDRFRFNKRILGYLYNYTSSSFTNQMNKAVRLMAPELRAREVPKLNELARELTKVPIRQTAVVRKFGEAGDHAQWFVVQISVDKNPGQKGHESVQFFYRVTLVDSEHKRSRSNPNLFELKAYEERKLTEAEMRELVSSGDENAQQH